jgi:hypothetical protein
MGLVVAATLLAPMPAAAFFWQCVAKDSRGTEYEDRSFGLFPTWVKDRASEKAIAKCEAGGGQSCVVKECIDLEAAPQEQNAGREGAVSDAPGRSQQW